MTYKLAQHHPLRVWRFQHGVTLKRLAYDANLPISTIVNVEKGCEPKYRNVRKICELTGLDFSDFYDRLKK